MAEPHLASITTARQAALRHGLRLLALPAGAAPTGDHAADRPTCRRVEQEAGPPPLCGGTVTGVAGRLPAPAGPLRAARRGPAWVPLPGLRADLAEVVAPVEDMTALSQRASTPRLPCQRNRLAPGGALREDAAMPTRLESLVVDAADPRALAWWWADALGWTVTAQEPHEGHCCVGSADGRKKARPRLGIRSPRPTPGMRPPVAGWWALQPPARNVRVAGSARTHARQRSPWHCGPARGRASDPAAPSTCRGRTRSRCWRTGRCDAADSRSSNTVG